MILEEIGIGGERVKMYNLSASEGIKFAEIAKEMTEQIKKLGPSPIKEGKFFNNTSSETKSSEMGT